MSDNEQRETAVDRAHRLLIERILDGSYPIGTELPGERPLSKELGVARNALREATQRLSHDGWLDISQGRATRVRDYLRDGNLNTLIDLLSLNQNQPMTFVPDLLQMWSLLAHHYTAQAVQNEPKRVAERLDLYGALEDTPEACAQAMWQLHRALIDYCGNVVYGLIFNSFADFYQRLAQLHYQDPANRDNVRDMWQSLCIATRELDDNRAAEIMSAYILASTVADLINNPAVNTPDDRYEEQGENH